jgi:hypothetical protein
MAETDSLLRCTFGPSAYQLLSWEGSEEPIVLENIGRAGSTVSIKGKGRIVGTSAADLATQIALALLAGETSGQDFGVWEHNVLTYLLPASKCRSGGPHIAIDIEDNLDGEPLSRNFNFTVKADTFLSPGFSATAVGFKTSTTTGPDGLRTVTRSGTYFGANADGIYTSQILPAFQALYPTPLWVVEEDQRDVDSFGTTLTYSMRAVELFATFPAALGIVDGEAHTRVDRDESMNLVTTAEFDLLLDPKIDPQTVYDSLRSLVSGPKTSWSITRIDCAAASR